MKKRFVSIVVVITVLCLLLVILIAKLGVQTALAGDWPMFRHDSVHSGVSSSTPALNPTLLWKFTVGSAIDSSPAVKDGIVYICSPSGEIFALNAANGNQIWNFTADGIYRSSPCVADGMVYIGSYGGQCVYALNATTGGQLWLFPTLFDKGYNRGIKSSPTKAQKIVYFTSDGGSLYAVNATSGEQVWAVHFANNGVSSSPAVVNGVVYVGAAAHDPFYVVETNGVYAFNASNGSPLWNYNGIGSVISSPSVGNGVVYVGSFDSNVYAINSSNGEKIWNYTTTVPLTDESGIILQRNTGGPVESSPAVADGIVYVGSYDHNFYALNATNGNKLWNYTTGNSVESSPAIAGDVVYLGSKDGNIYALNATSGNLIWSYATLGAVTSSPAVANGVVYVGSSDGNIYALGNPQMTTNAPSPTVPEFSVKLVNGTIELKIKNQPFVSYYDTSINWSIDLYYNIRIKGDFSEDWIELYRTEEVPVSSYSEYTNLSYSPIGENSYILGNRMIDFPAGSQVDFQVKAMIGYVQRVFNPNATSHLEMYPYVFTGETSSWSATRTIPEQELHQTVALEIIFSIILIVTVIGACLLVYFKKRHHTKINNHSVIEQSSTSFYKLLVTKCFLEKVEIGS